MIALICLALAAAAGPVLVVVIVGRVASDFAQQFLRAVDATSARILGHLNEHRMIGGKPRDLYDQELRLEERRIELDAKRQEMLVQEHLAAQRTALGERDPFSGRRTD